MVHLSKLYKQSLYGNLLGGTPLLIYLALLFWTNNTPLLYSALFLVLFSYNWVLRIKVDYLGYCMDEIKYKLDKNKELEL